VVVEELPENRIDKLAVKDNLLVPDLEDVSAKQESSTLNKSHD
jgi:hypothetical protein